MAQSNKLMFDNLTSIGSDQCGLTQRNVQNMAIGDYLTTGFFNSDCGMKQPINLATNQPGVFFSGSSQVGLGGCNIDTNSELRNPVMQKEFASRLDLNERPYVTVPYMGRGVLDCDTESHLVQGESNLNRKSVTTISDMTFMDFRNYPLIPDVEENIQNPKNLIEESASDDWIRGGLPSRDTYRDKEYFKNKN